MSHPYLLAATVMACTAALAMSRGLVDHPVVADSVTYLDGTWQASARPTGGPSPSPAPSTSCRFTKGQDYRSTTSNNTGRPVRASSPEECCGVCQADASCFAAVYTGQAGGEACWVKTAADCSGGAYMRQGHAGITSCLKAPAPPAPPAPPGPPPAPAVHTMSGAVPGDVLTDLQNAGLIGDPLYELNFQNATLWNGYSWTYATTFTMTPGQLAAARAGAVSHVLVFDGIKMGANIHVNGMLVGQVADQFLRYVFDIEASLLKAGAGANTIEVTFENEIDCGGRWMSCTGGWDWAPYTTTSQGGAATFSKGIWKSVYIAEVASAAITHIVPQIFYKGAYPVVPLTEGDHDGFDVEVRVHMWAPLATSGTLTAMGEWGGAASQLVHVPAGDSLVILKTTASAAQIKLWWPAGHGAQPLYNLTVAFTAAGAPQADANPISGTRQVGFRFFALVTGDDTDPDYVKKNADGDGTSTNGMFWRINGAAILSKGANMIPMEELEGRMSADAHVQLVQNAVDGGMNTLRVWGGGMFLPNAFYDTCDALGIMIYHDMQYAQQGHSPANTTNQDAELRHQVRRLSHHPSIVMWDGCNECHVVMGTNTGIYATFVMTVVAQEDMSRVVWPSCPASGWTSGVNTLTSLPNGKALTTPVGGPRFETHGPYQHGGGFPAVNGNAGSALFSSNIPIQVSTGATGLNESNVFASEFGCSVYSSFESMSPTLKEEHWGIQGGSPADDCHGGFASHCKGDNVMAQRNYPCNNIISVYFGGGNFNATGEQVFKKQLWQCMVGQALVIKQNIETRRAKNEFGIIVWQFNEIWPTGGWGSIEYGTVGYTKGQVLGGRWKPLQYWYRKTIYTDVMVACGNAGQDDTSQVCYVNNGSPFPFTGTVQIDAVDFATGAATSLASKQLALPAGAGVTEFFTIDASNFDGVKAILHGVVKSGAGEVVNDNWMPMVEPKKMALPKASVRFDVADTANMDGSVDIIVMSDKFALYVTLTTLAQGRFSDNAFCMVGGRLKVQFIPVQGFELAELKSSLRVEHAAAYMF